MFTRRNMNATILPVKTDRSNAGNENILQKTQEGSVQRQTNNFFFLQSIKSIDKRIRRFTAHRS